MVSFVWSEEQTAEQREEVFTFKLTPPTGELSPDAYRVESDKLMDYDARKGIIYGKERTRIYYGKYYLEADRIIVDDHAKEVQAEGNVILRSPVDEVKAEYVRYHLEKHEGYAKGVYGRHGDFFFKAPEKEEQPAFVRLSEQESLLRETSLTTCDFSTPHYMVRAREFIIYTNERVFARSAVLYLRGIPVFYFPFYTRSLREHSPWSFELGYSSALGAYARVGYDYWHSLYEPKLGDEKEMVKRSSGHLSAHIDYFAKRGLGYGLDYKYKFDYGRHHGETLLYAIKDRNRKIEGEEEDYQ
ncbi:MAG: hypothetical protein N2246_05090, partial [Candidatus Sumerlaeia bacterium]|nr:hypothetical protein [Candidatus Sumerlaeia bacterium]